MSNTSFTDKPCCEPNCNNPRMVSSSGHQLVRCEQHQRAEWAARKRDANAAHLIERPCKSCQVVKPIEDFGLLRPGCHRAVCKDCYKAIQREQYRAQSEAYGRQVKSHTSSKPKTEGRTAQPRKDRQPAPIVMLPESSVLLVDPLRGQAVVVQVLSEIPNGAKRLEHLIAAYQSRGVRVLEIVEKTESRS